VVRDGLTAPRTRRDQVHAAHQDVFLTVGLRQIMRFFRRLGRLLIVEASWLFSMVRVFSARIQMAT